MSPAGRRVMTALVLAAVALPIGTWRLAVLDAGAARLSVGERAAVSGTVGLVPRRFGDGMLFTLDTDAGRVAVRAPGRAATAGPVAGTLPGGNHVAVDRVSAGDRVRVVGVVEPGGEWIDGYLRRFGTRGWINASRVISEGPARAGPAGLLDAIRNRAMSAIDEAVAPSQAALMRGFVLGDDSAVDPVTAEAFKRSGLAHLLAVSGQNVILLLAFGSAVLIAFGVPRRRRWPALAALVAIYVPIAGAGPSIQRAGIMGLVGLLAASLERPLDRWWTLYLAAVVTLAANPLSIGDVGWQLSFAAVAGIAVGARPLARRTSAWLGAGSTGARAGLAEGIAITVAATLATAPLMAHHFEAVPLAAVPANLLALPAVAPAMWSGMALATAGQVPGLPLELIGVPAGYLVGFVGWAADLTARPEWALADVSLGSWWSVLAVYILIGSLIVWGKAAARRSAGLLTARPRRIAIGTGLVAVALIVAASSGQGPRQATERPWHFEARFFDVGQGDSILLRDRHGTAVLIDTGYAGSGIARRLKDLGLDRLAALILTHGDADHAGDLEGLVAALPVGRVFTNGLEPDLDRRVRALGLQLSTVAAGDRLRLGAVRLDVIWPRPNSPDPGDEPNDAAVVAVAGWRGFSALLTGDAEAEAAPYFAADVDVLKIPHHGSADAGLESLLDRTSPELAVISVGSENPYGHPTAGTVDAIADARVPLLRTDENSEIQIAVTKRSWAAFAG